LSTQGDEDIPDDLASKFYILLTSHEGQTMTKSEELMQQATELQRQAEEVRKQELAEVIVQIRGLIAQHHLEASDLGFHGRASASVKTRDGRRPVAPRYLDPASGSTWTGRGRKPRWLEAAMKAGHSAERYLIGA
jgi:DNA-binding protein H-NS